jgi:hypothetical protein
MGLRAELEYLEQVPVEDMLNEDKDHRKFAGVNLIQAI